MNSIFCWVSKLTVTKTRRKHQYGHKYGRPERDNLVRKETGKKKVSKIYFNKGNFCLKSASISDPFFFFLHYIFSIQTQHSFSTSFSGSFHCALLQPCATKVVYIREEKLDVVPFSASGQMGVTFQLHSCKWGVHRSQWKSTFFLTSWKQTDT